MLQGVLLIAELGAEAASEVAGFWSARHMIFLQE
jgi:hypothetical protein